MRSYFPDIDFYIDIRYFVSLQHLLAELHSDSDEMLEEDDEEDEDDDDDEDDDEDEEEMLMRLQGEELDETGSDVGSEYNFETLKDALGLTSMQVGRRRKKCR